MRIGMILSTPLPPGEGIGFYVWNLARYLTRQGHQVQLITRGGIRPTPREEVENITIWRPPFAPVYPFHVHLHSLFVNHLIRRLEPTLDLLHLHTPLVKYPQTHLPTLVTIHSLMKTATAVTAANNILGWLIKLQTPVSCRLERELLQQADRLVTVARGAINDLPAYGVDPQFVKTLGNGVNTNNFYPPRRYVTSQPPYFLTVGRLAPPKGIEDLIACADLITKQFPDYRFYVAGAGPLKQTYQAEITRRKLETRVILLGHIASQAKLAELYQGATAYVHTAHYEGLPTVLLEAMACARPVITTAVSGALEVVQDGQNGLLVPPKNPAVMAQAIIRLLQSPGWGDRLGQAALETIQQRYDWDVVSRNYIAEYERLVAGEAR
jgi:glycosyltransferase involved in cell wall biosynthesis